MKNRIFILCMAAFFLSILIFTNAYAASEEVEEYYLDLDSIKEIKKQDDCPVKITSVELKQNGKDGDEHGNDAMICTLKNDTGQNIEEFSIYIVAYDDDFRQIKFWPEGYERDGSYVEEIYHLNCENFQNNTEFIYTLGCQMERFSNVEVIMNYYITADGIAHSSSVGTNWLYLVISGRKKYDSIKQPDKNEYDEIVARGDSYFLCSKFVEENNEIIHQYAVYDALTGEWPFEYGKIPSSELIPTTVFYARDGDFCYQNEIGTVTICTRLASLYSVD